MALADPTLDAAIDVWGETVSLQRSPAVAVDAVVSTPDALRDYDMVSVGTIDAAVTVRASDADDLEIEAREKITVRGNSYQIVLVQRDDGAGAALLLRRIV